VQARRRPWNTTAADGIDSAQADRFSRSQLVLFAIITYFLATKRPRPPRCWHGILTLAALIGLIIGAFSVFSS